MNKFIIILSNESALDLDETSKKVVAALNLVSPKVLPILPHIVLFEHSGDLKSAAHIVDPILISDRNWILIQVHHDFRGIVKKDRMADLQRFFAL